MRYLGLKSKKLDQKATSLCFYFNSSTVTVTGQTFNKNCCWNNKSWTGASIIGEATTMRHARTGASAIVLGDCPRWQCTTIVARQFDYSRMDLTRRVWKCLEFCMDLHSSFHCLEAWTFGEEFLLGDCVKKTWIRAAVGDWVSFESDETFWV